jgi:hypothetical protein
MQLTQLGLVVEEEQVMVLEVHIGVITVVPES